MIKTISIYISSYIVIFETLHNAHLVFVMGVQGLWDLLGVTGRRVEVQALGNKKIAVDASIWVVQVQKRRDVMTFLANKSKNVFIRKTSGY